MEEPTSPTSTQPRKKAKGTWRRYLHGFYQNHTSSRKKVRARVVISPELVDPAAGQQILAAGAAPADLGGPNGASVFVRVFSGPLVQSLAAFLTLREASYLQQVCKAFLFGGFDPLKFVEAATIALPRTYKQLDRLGPLRHITFKRVYNVMHPTDTRLHYLADRFGPSLTSMHCDRWSPVLAAFSNLREMVVVQDTINTDIAPFIRSLQHLRILRIGLLTCSRYASLIQALCESPSCPLLTELEYTPVRCYHWPHPLSQRAWAPALLKALQDGRLASLESLTLCLPPQCPSGMDVKEVVAQGINATALPRLRRLRLSHPWPSYYVSQNDMASWEPVWADVWDRLDPSILEQIKMDDLSGGKWPNLQRCLARQAFPRLKELACFAMGAAAHDIGPLCESLRRGHLPSLTSLGIADVRFDMDAASARALGRALEGQCPRLRQLCVRARSFTTTAGKELIQMAASRRGVEIIALDAAAPEAVGSLPLDLPSMRHVASLDIRALALPPARLSAIAAQCREESDAGRPFLLRRLAIAVALKDEQAMEHLEPFAAMLGDGCLPRLVQLNISVFWPDAFNRRGRVMQGRITRRVAAAYSQCRRRDGQSRSWTVT